jgi:hypothetical protein
MNTSMKRRGGVIALSVLIGAAIGSIFQAPITGAVILPLLTAGGLFLLSRIRLGPM